ncbi:hypothetical protein HMPREF9457_03806, partial [Dorea formicigenerans 4_6_53AFAA]
MMKRELSILFLPVGEPTLYP